MNKQVLKNLIIAAVGLVIVGSVYGGYKKYVDISENISYLNPPEEFSAQGGPASGWEIEVWAEGLPGARVMAFDLFGNIWVSQTREGKVSLIEIGEDGRPAHIGAVFRGLNNPHGLAFDPADGLRLFIAEEDKISRVGTYSEGHLEKIADFPRGGGHSTRTIGFGPDGRLYVSIGSSCNVCNEADERRAKIYSMNKDGSDFKEFARGLRNAVFFTWSYIDGRMWATEMGRDWLGDDLPPDEINIVKEGKNYGWPICYGKNIHDTNFDKNTYLRNPCQEPFETPSYIDLQAHSAPLGLAFVPEEGPASPSASDRPSRDGDGSQGGWPEEYWYDLLVAYHGSWNRSEATGYKIARIDLDEKGNYLGTYDFITGWLQNGAALGRPVDIKLLPGGIGYITDDKAGVVYRITVTKD